MDEVAVFQNIAAGDAMRDDRRNTDAGRARVLIGDFRRGTRALGLEQLAALIVQLAGRDAGTHRQHHFTQRLGAQMPDRFKSKDIVFRFSSHKFIVS